MTAFKVDNFGGVIPRLGPRLLPTNGAQIADNAKLFSGELRSWFKAAVVNVPSRGGAIKSIYRMYDTSSNYWLSSTADVDYVKGPIAGDTAFKIYFTGEVSTGTNYQAGPRKTNFALATGGGTDYPHDWLEMGIPAPGAAPSVSSTGGTSTNTVVRVYTYTYVTQTASWAEEGPPSPTGTGTGKPDATWFVGSLSTGTTGKYAFTSGEKRVYRTLTDSAGNTNYQLATAIPISVTTATDATADGDLGVICPTFIPGIAGSEWVAPPSDLKGLIALPNGMMAGFSGNLICFCEPFRPHAWPLRYRLATNFDIVSMGRYGQTVIVTTKGFPYAVVGSRPDSMAMAVIEENHPCVSKRGTVSFPWGVAWPTPDGMALAGVGGALNVIEPFMKRDEWRALCYPETIIAHQFQNVYFGFFNNGVADLNFIFDKDNKQGPLTFGNFNAQGAWNDPETSKLYLVQNGIITQWDSDPNYAPFDWKSKTFVLPRPVNFGAIQVDADYGQLDDAQSISTASAANYATNLIILGGTNADTQLLTAWTGTGTYASGTVVKSVDGVKMLISVVGGTSTNVEPTWPSTLGGTATDGPTLKWKRIWDLEGRTKGELNGAVNGWHIQYNQNDPIFDGTAGNQWGFPLAGSLLIGGTYPVYDNRGLLLQVYAMTTGTDTDLVHSQQLTSREVQRLPKGFKSDSYEFRLSGNVAVRYFKVAETANELRGI